MPLGDALYVVSVSVDPDHEADFNTYYHRDHIPAVFVECRNVNSAWRYEQFGVDGSLQWYDRRFHTLYTLEPGLNLEQLSRNGILAQDHPALASWRTWQSHLHNVERAAYRVVYEHSRSPWDGPFGSRPFFLVIADISEQDEPDFARWYHQEYLPRNVAEVPTWAAVRRYESVGRERRRTFVVYEAWDQPGLARSLALMRGASRIGENLDWHRWERVIAYQDAGTFRPIFRWPG